MRDGLLIPTGGVVASVIRPVNLDRRTIDRLTDPFAGNTEEAADWRNENRHAVRRQAKPLRLIEKLGGRSFYGALFLKKIAADGQVHDLGLASLRVVTDTGVGFIVDAFQNLVELENMKYHGIGTGVTAEAAAQTALITELTTEYNPNSTRATGTTTEAAANIYQTVATNSVDATVAITEHGVFTQAATGGGVMLDRSLFSAINLVSGDSLQTDYRLTLTSGG